MTKPSIYLLLFSIIILGCHSSSTNDRLELLSGHWQVIGQNQYEFWKAAGPNQWVGYGYQLNDKDTIFTEHLQLKQIDNHLTYQATVSTQNEGQTIAFTLNENHGDTLVFENYNHDFPQKIQYYFLAPDTLYIDVSGENGTGFNYFMAK